MLTILLCVLFVAVTVVVCVLGIVEHGDVTQRQQTKRQAVLVAACKVAADPQTCLELLISPDTAHIINK